MNVDPDNFRLVNVVASVLVAGTLSWRHFYYRAHRGIDNRLRSATSIAVFAVSAIASGTAWSRDLPVPFYVYLLTAALTAYLIALWTPWRWHLPRR